MPAYIEALADLRKNEYEPARLKLENVSAQAPRIREKVLRMLIYTSLQAKKYDDTALYLAKQESKFKLLPNDMFYKGCLQSLTFRHDEAIATYSEVLKKDKIHVLALNNIAAELIEKEAHQVAERALDKAIKLNPKLDHPYANLGYSKILQDDLEAGKLLVEKCLELNAENADAYKALGIYYAKKKDVNQAAVNFKKAVELDNDIDLKGYDKELKLTNV